MKIVCISDTHGKHAQLKNIPDGDVLIHCGDCTEDLGQWALRDFLKWFQAQPHKHKILIAGNHDGVFEKWPNETKAFMKEYAPDCVYLQDSGVEIDGVKFWGSPVTPEFFNWFFNRNRGKDIRRHWELIPADTNVLITHGPGYGTLDKVLHLCGMERDYNQGCHDLRQVIDTKLKQLKAHVFGHLHLEGGKTIKRDSVTYVNAACVDEKYRITGTVQTFDI